MSKSVQRVVFSESTNGLPVIVNDEIRNIHFTPENSLDEVWAWISTATSSPATVTLSLNNVDFEFTVNSENSPVLAVPGVTFDRYISEPNTEATLKASTSGNIVVHGYVNRIE
jgi:hypothetical protein